ncbi:MAG TPA: hypothetical protein VN758_05030 [Solirubrobacterales bacterium]|nr:hypothetical protein [Solirubrobacterales bacterium]
MITACLATPLLALPAAAGAAGSKSPVRQRGAWLRRRRGRLGLLLEHGRHLPAAAALRERRDSFQGSGGADGGGFIRSAYTGVVGAMGVAGTTTAVWQSPPFTYSGAAGAVPTALNFHMDRRASVDQLLAVDGNSAEFWSAREFASAR